MDQRSALEVVFIQPITALSSCLKEGILHPLNMPSVYRSLETGQLSVVQFLQAVEEGRDVENVDCSSNQSKDRLLSVLRTVRRSSWERYLQIMLMASDPKGVAMNEIATRLEEKPQTVHPLLKRMLERKALTREKRGLEYYYFLAPSLSRDDVDSQLREIADELTDKLSLIRLDDEEESERDQFEINQVNQVAQTDSSTKGERDSEGVEMTQSAEAKDKAIPQPPKLPALPEFNPNWNESQQDRWFSLYEKIIALQERLEK